MSKVLTDAERQQRRRAKLKAECLKPILVRGKNGEFDERIRIALAIKSLALNGQLSETLIDLIAKEAEDVFPATDNATKKFINHIVKKYLEDE